MLSCVRLLSFKPENILHWGEGSSMKPSLVCRTQQLQEPVAVMATSAERPKFVSYGQQFKFFSRTMTVSDIRTLETINNSLRDSHVSCPVPQKNGMSYSAVAFRWTRVVPLFPRWNAGRPRDRPACCLQDLTGCQKTALSCMGVVELHSSVVIHTSGVITYLTFQTD